MFCNRIVVINIILFFYSCMIWPKKFLKTPNTYDLYTVTLIYPKLIYDQLLNILNYLILAVIDHVVTLLYMLQSLSFKQY